MRTTERAESEGVWRPSGRAAAMLAVVVACSWCAPLSAQTPNLDQTPIEWSGLTGAPVLPVAGSDSNDGYLAGTLALGIPSALLSAANLQSETPSLWRGVAGIGLGVGHGALFIAGLREEDPPSGTEVWLNALASTFSTVSGILQIRSTLGEGPKASSFRASISPRVDGFRLRMTLKH